MFVNSVSRRVVDDILSMRTISHTNLVRQLAKLQVEITLSIRNFTDFPFDPDCVLKCICNPIYLLLILQLCTHVQIPAVNERSILLWVDSQMDGYFVGCLGTLSTVGLPDTNQSSSQEIYGKGEFVDNNIASKAQDGV